MPGYGALALGLTVVRSNMGHERGFSTFARDGETV